MPYVYMLVRAHIENRDAPAIAAELTAAFDKFCAAPTAVWSRSFAAPPWCGLSAASGSFVT